MPNSEARTARASSPRYGAVSHKDSMNVETPTQTISPAIACTYR